MRSWEWDITVYCLQYPHSTSTLQALWLRKGEVRSKMNFTCVRVCGVEGRGKSLSGQFFFVCEKDDREESSTKSLGGMTRPKDEMGSQIVSSESDISHPILVYLSRNNTSQAQAWRFPALTAPEPEFPVIFGSKWDPLTSAWRQPRETRRTSDGRLSSPETNLKVGLLPLFFMQLLLSHMFLSLMVRTSPLMRMLRRPTHVALIFVKPALRVGWEGTVITHSQLLIHPPPLPFAMHLRNGYLSPYIVASSSI